MTPSKDSRPREYWAFRFGRLAVQLPRVIEQAYIHDSLPIDEPAVEDKADHPRDKFPSVDRVFADIEEALINLRDNGPSNLKTAAEDAFKAFDEFKRLILHALVDGDSVVVANHFSFLQDECLPRRGQSFDDSVLREFLATFRGDQKPTNPEKLGRGRPKKTINVFQIKSPNASNLLVKSSPSLCLFPKGSGSSLVQSISQAQSGSFPKSINHRVHSHWNPLAGQSH